MIKQYILTVFMSLALYPIDTAIGQVPSANSSTDWASFFPNGQVPHEIFGNTCTEHKLSSNTNSYLLHCKPRNLMERPSINVIIRRMDKPETYQEMIANTQSAFHERSMFNIVREESIGLEGKPEAFGFRAIYQTEMGNRYVWSLQQNGYLLTTMATIFAPTDNAKLKQDVESKVYGTITQMAVPLTKDKP
jgi:hypothetical protein